MQRMRYEVVEALWKLLQHDGEAAVWYWLWDAARAEFIGR